MMCINKYAAGGTEPVDEPTGTGTEDESPLTGTEDGSPGTGVEDDTPTSTGDAIIGNIEGEWRSIFPARNWDRTGTIFPKMVN